ncbi:MAG: serine hydroxymethyltransferase [Planctomycetes bacterium]|nr:serine hydroxymethyltransferase [Planctomycetota bacterium]
MAQTKSFPARTAENRTYRGQLVLPLAQMDPAVHSIIQLEKARQQEKLILIASESMCPQAVREANASEFSHLYAEGYPSERMAHSAEGELLDLGVQLTRYRRESNRRYYKGCEYADLIESLAMRRAAEIFACPDFPADRIFVNVQPLSGAAANNAVYDAFVKPGETVMGMLLAHGGHLTHGSPVNRSGKYHCIVSYGIRQDTGRIDYEEIRDLALKHRPRMIIGGYSAYPWTVDWHRFRSIADEVGAVLMADISHYAGLVVAGLYPNPVGVADVTTLTTHKTLCGPRGAIILTTHAEKAKAVDFAVFPGEQGGPHINNIAARAVCFHLAATPEFRDLQSRIVRNCRALAAGLERRGLKVAYGGTETHLCLVDLRSLGSGGEAWLHGEMASRLLDLCGITCNKNTIAGDRSAFEPSGIRLGTPWVTQRGLNEQHMDVLAGLIHRVVSAARPYTQSGPRGLQHLAKLPLEVFREAREGVASLIESADPSAKRGPFGYPLDQARARERPWPSPLRAEKKSKFPMTSLVQEGAALADASDRGILRVRGERAWPFLQAALSASLSGLQPGQSLSSDIHDSNGACIDTVRVHCVSRFVFWLQTSTAHKAKKVHQWLSLLSDGAVETDPEDPWRTLDGPVVVEPLHESGPDGHGGRWCTIVVLGARAEEVAAALNPDLENLVTGEHREFPMGAGTARAARSSTPAGTRFDLLVRPSDAQNLWRAAAAAGAVPAALRKSTELPRDAATARPDKPYFIGQGRRTSVSPKKPPFEFQAPVGELKRTCLYEVHAALTPPSRIVPFGGWAMPVCYGQTSIADEHGAVRSAAALFDVSHMGILELSGPEAGRFLDLVTTNEAGRLPVGRAHYSFLLEAGGQPLDDITLYRLEMERYVMVVNASNAEKAESWLRGVNERRWCIDADSPGKEVDATAIIRNLKSPDAGEHQRVDLALQGPRSRELLERLLDRPADRERLRSLKRFAFFTASLQGMELWISATGYTGEPIGYEVYVHPERARKLWSLLLEAGADLKVIPAGLAARDSARIEAGYPLFGHELAGPFAISPIEAGYPSFLRLNKPFFVGRAAVIEARKARARIVVRFQVLEASARAVRAEDPVLGPGGQTAGRVTSCARVGESQIGMAIVSRELRAEGTPLAIQPRPRTKREEGRSADPIPARVLPRFLKKD